MTKAELHEIAEVKRILISQELNKICCHLREHIPYLKFKGTSAEEIISNGAKLVGWLECVEALRDLKNLDEPTIIQPVTRRYPDRT